MFSESTTVATPLQSEHRRPLRPRLQRGLLAAFARAADFLDGRPAFGLCLLVVCFLTVTTLEARTCYLTNDEVYTVHIAQAPTLTDMWRLEREIDLHPPVHYLLQRESLRLPLPRWFTARLPSLLAGLIATLALYGFARRRLGPLFALTAALLFCATPALEYSWINRPYMLWLCFLSLLLLTYSRARSHRRAPWVLPAVFALTLAMIGTHLLGILCLGPFLLAEAWRAWRRSRFDWALLAALCVPALGGLGFQYQISHMSANAFPVGQQPSLQLLLDVYRSLLHTDALLVSISVALFAVLFGVASRSAAAPPPWRREREPASAKGGLRRYDLLILFCFLAFPLLLGTIGFVLHMQFWARYGAPATPAVALLAVWLLSERIPMGRLLAVVVVASSVVYMVSVGTEAIMIRAQLGRPLNGVTPIPLGSLDPTLPIVTASPMTFVEMSDREAPAIARRVFYLTDLPAAYTFAHYTLFENEGKVRRLLNLPSQTEDLTPFLKEHKRFYMVGDYNAPQIWLVRKLASTGVNLDYLGKFLSTYESNDLYLVSQ